MTVIEPAGQIVGREEFGVAREIDAILRGERVEFALNAQPQSVHGLSGDMVAVTVRTDDRERKIESSDLIVAVGPDPNPADIGLDKAGVKLTRGATSASTSAYKRRRRACGRSANAPAARSSPISRWTISKSSPTLWPAAGALPRTGKFLMSCSPVRPWRASVYRKLSLSVRASPRASGDCR